MSVLLWNIRGAGSEASLLYLQEMIRLHKPDLIGILEPKQNSRKIEDFSRKIGYEGWFHGIRVIHIFGYFGRITCKWKIPQLQAKR